MAWKEPGGKTIKNATHLEDKQLFQETTPFEESELLFFGGSVAVSEMDCSDAISEAAGILKV